MKAKISEIFSSIQGEGVYQGVSQLFFRFYGCNLNCDFCDTRLEFYREYDLKELLQELCRFNGRFHSLAFTGGEPLLQAGFLKRFLRSVKKNNFTTYLETNGTLPENLKELIDDVDIVAMDIKLPGSTKSRSYWAEHLEFLKIASVKDLFVKSVICSTTEDKDLSAAIDLLASLGGKIPFILQPNCYELNESLISRIEDFRRLALKSLREVRVIPQIHKVLGVR